MRKLIGIAAALLAACGGNGQQQMPPPDVNVAAVVEKQVTEWDEYSGHVEAIQSAEIRPRVGGHLQAIHYEEGGLVKEGQQVKPGKDWEHGRQAQGGADPLGQDAAQQSAQ